jgi:hypothetical protein
VRSVTTIAAKNSSTVTGLPSSPSWNPSSLASGSCTAALPVAVACPVPIDADLASRPLQAHGALNKLDHFKELWTLAMLGFLRSAHRGDVPIFAPELLASTHYYARPFPDASGQLAEESDRYVRPSL